MSVDLLNLITLDDLQDENHQMLVECIGLEAFRKLVRKEGGWRISIPSEERVISGLRNHLITEEYNGYNAKELGKKYGISESSIQKIIRRNGGRA